MPTVAATSHSPSTAGGSPHLAETLNDLLTQMTSEVETVSALSARIDDAARDLQGMLGEYVERIATLARLRSIADAGPLAQFLDQELRPERPTELTTLDESSAAAQQAEV